MEKIFACKVTVDVGLLQNSALVYLLHVLLQDVQLQFGEALYIFLVYQFVAVNSLRLVEPESHQVRRRLEALVSAEQ